MVKLEEPNLPIPNADVDKDIRRKWFLGLCQKYVEKHLGCHATDLISQTNKLQKNSKGPYPCREESCESRFVYHSRCVRCEPYLNMYNRYKCISLWCFLNRALIFYNSIQCHTCTSNFNFISSICQHLYSAWHTESYDMIQYNTKTFILT